jgi:hypothetical protein
MPLLGDDGPCVAFAGLGATMPRLCCAMPCFTEHCLYCALPCAARLYHAFAERPNTGPCDAFTLPRHVRPRLAFAVLGHARLCLALTAHRLAAPCHAFAALYRATLCLCYAAPRRARSCFAFAERCVAGSCCALRCLGFAELGWALPLLGIAVLRRCAARLCYAVASRC